MKKTTLSKNWQEKNNRLVLDLKLDNFMKAVKIVNEIANIAERLNHHPDLCIYQYKNLKIEIYTHTTHAITDKDRALALEIDKVV